MPRPTRKKLTFDEDSVNKLLQEIYYDSHVIKSKINRLMVKWETKVKEPGEIVALGDTIIKLITAESKNQDQKIMLLKYLKEVVFENRKLSGNGDAKNEDTGTTSDDRRNELITMVHEELERKKILQNDNN